MELQHIITVIVVLIGIVFLWQKRATPNQAAPPSDEKIPDPKTPAPGRASAEPLQQIIARLIAVWRR